MNISFRTKTFFIVSITFIVSFFYQSTTATALVTTPFYDIRVDTTLDASATYLINNDFRVSSGVTLTVPAGTHFIFTPYGDLKINGTLIANGTPTKHISIIEGDEPPFIPSADFTIPTQTQTSEVQSPDVEPIVIIPVPDTETPETQSSEISPLVTNTVMMTKEAGDSAKSLGISFNTGSNSTLSYIDISDALIGGILSDGATVTFSHATFKNCDTGILGNGEDTLKLTSVTFDTVDIPVDWNFHGTFTHSNSIFINSGIKGWRYGGDIHPGEDLHLNSTDGEYEIPYVTIPKDGSLTVNPGVTIKMMGGDGRLQVTGGKLSMKGTTDKPITVYNDDIVCSSHTPIIALSDGGTAFIGHTSFHNLCSGIESLQSNITISNDRFETIAGPVVKAVSSKIVVDTVKMNDIYEAFDVQDGSNLKLSSTDISLVNTPDTSAVYAHNQSLLTMTDSSVDQAGTCVMVAFNSAIVADTIKLSHCSQMGLGSINSSVDTTASGITLTNSDISDSGTAIYLEKAVVQDVSHDTFESNDVAVSLRDMKKTTMINNWWESDLGPRIDSNPDGDGERIILDTVSEFIYRPWTGMTTPPEHNPIIIVPGITGSVLTKDYDDKSELWPNITKLALSPTDSFLNDLELLQSGTPSSVHPVEVGDIVRSAASADIFNSFIQKLSENGYTEGKNLFVLPYDWRLSNTVNQALLKDAITAALAKSGKSKVNIIAHSMGGLLVKDYIAQNPAAPIDHLFNIAVPHIGAPKAFKTLMYGDDMGFHFSVGSLQVPVLNADRAKIISQNMPSVYELLPSKKYVDTIGSYVTDLTKNSSTLDVNGVKDLMIADGRNEKMFPFAQTLHDATDSLDVSKFSAYDFVGCGSTKTVSGYTITKKQSFLSAGLQLVPEYRLSYSDGDGVVPMNSANAGNGAINLYVKGGSHGTMPSVPVIQNAIISVLNGSNGVETNNDLAAGSNICASAPGSVVEVHSPVTLDVYDDQGRHTGPTTDGNIEFGIPNSQYDVMGEEKFVFLPAGSTYKIITHAEAVGAYDMYISLYDQFNTKYREAYFNAVPLATAQAVGTLMLNNQENYTITIDGDGDSHQDSIIAASAILSQNQLNDVTPPTTYSKVVGTTVGLFGSDEGSGVLNTKYSTDNKTWKTYTEPFEVLPATTVYFVSLDKAGNTEEIRHVEIPKTSSGDDNSDQSTGSGNNSGAGTNGVSSSGAGGGGPSYIAPTVDPVIATTIPSISNTIVPVPDIKSDTVISTAYATIPQTVKSIAQSPITTLSPYNYNLLANADLVIPKGKRNIVRYGIAGVILILIAVFIKKRY